MSDTTKTPEEQQLAKTEYEAAITRKGEIETTLQILE